MKVSDIKKFPFCSYSIHSSWNFLEETFEMWNERGELNLDPDFQRGHVWSEQKQIEYVEFCLRGGESSRELLFNHPGWQSDYKGQMVLVDGKQRLNAVRKFMADQLPIFGNNKLSDFDDPKRLLRSKDASFTVKVNNLKTKKDVLEWYLDLNSGGVVHTQEELDKVKNMLKKLLKNY